VKRLEPVIQHFGGQSKLAAALGISQVAVHFWVREDALPAKRAIQVERITNGKFKAADLVEVSHE